MRSGLGGAARAPERNSQRDLRRRRSGDGGRRFRWFALGSALAVDQLVGRLGDRRPKNVGLVRGAHSRLAAACSVGQAAGRPLAGSAVAGCVVSGRRVRAERGGPAAGGGSETRAGRISPGSEWRAVFNQTSGLPSGEAARRRSGRRRATRRSVASRSGKRRGGSAIAADAPRGETGQPQIGCRPASAKPPTAAATTGRSTNRPATSAGNLRQQHPRSRLRCASPG